MHCCGGPLPRCRRGSLRGTWTDVGVQERRSDNAPCVTSEDDHPDHESQDERFVSTFVGALRNKIKRLTWKPDTSVDTPTTEIAKE